MISYPHFPDIIVLVSFNMLRTFKVRYMFYANVIIAILRPSNT